MRTNTSNAIVNDRRTTLAAFSRTLQLESHVLKDHPDLLWQQMYNRLQWQGERVSILADKEYELRIKSTSVPWARTRIPFRESEASAGILKGHQKGINACDMSPDGAWIVSASSDKTLKIWDSVSGKELRSLEGHQSTIYDCAVSPDGKQIVSASGDKSLIIWDAISGKELQRIVGNHGQVLSCAMSPDSGWFVSGYESFDLDVWDMASCTKIRSLRGHSSSVNSCAVSPDGKWIVSASDDETLIVWDAAKGEIHHTLMGHRGPVNACSISLDGKWIVSAGSFMVKVWDLISGSELLSMHGHSDAVDSCAFSPDNRYIISASRDTSLKIWDGTNGEELDTLTGHSNSVYDCVVSPSSNHIISASEDKTLRMWSLVAGKSNETVPGHKYWVNSCAISSDGMKAISTSADSTLKVWDSTSWTEIHSLSGHGNELYGCTVSPDNACIVAGGGNQLQIWDANTGEERLLDTGHPKGIVYGEYDCAVTPDGSRIISVSSDKTVRVWDLHSGEKLLSLIGHREGVNTCAISPDGAWFVSGSSDKTLRIWDADDGRLRLSLTGHEGSVSGCDVSPDGAWIVSASDDGTLFIWDAVSGIEQRILVGHEGPVRDCKVSPDGTTIVSVGTDSTLRVWDLDDGQQLLIIPLLAPLRCVAFHAWKPLVMVGDNGGNLYLIEMVGLPSNPVVVTATNNEQGVKVRCPACARIQSISSGSLGGEISCSSTECSLSIKLNPFVVVEHLEKTATRIPSESHPYVKWDGHQDIKALAIADSGLAIAGYADGSTAVWEPDLDQPDIVENAHKTPVTAISIKPDGSLAVSGSLDGTLHLWDLIKRTHVGKLQLPANITSLAFGPKNQVAIGFRDGELRVWNMENPAKNIRLQIPAEVSAVALLPSGYLASGFKDNKLLIWNLIEGELFKKFANLPSSVSLLGASTYEDRLAAALSDGRMLRWSLEEADSIGVIKGDLLSPLSAVVANQALILSGDMDGKVKVIALDSKMIVYQREYGISIQKGALSSDGKRGVVCDDRGGVFRFDV